MRCGIIVAAAAGAVIALSATGARAEEWCGYAAHPGSIIQCGYTSVEGCETTIGKGAMCFLNPDLALDFKRARPATGAKPLAAKG